MRKCEERERDEEVCEERRERGREEGGRERKRWGSVGRGEGEASPKKRCSRQRVDRVAVCETVVIRVQGIY